MDTATTSKPVMFADLNFGVAPDPDRGNGVIPSPRHTTAGIADPCTQATAAEIGVLKETNAVSRKTATITASARAAPCNTEG